MKPDKRQLIMRAAEALFSKGRFHEITMDDVSRKAGVGKGTLYRYFKDKDDLFREVVLSGFDDLCRLVRAEGDRAEDVRSCLVKVSERLSEFHSRRRQVLHMMQSEERRALRRRDRAREEWLKRHRTLVDAVAHIVARGQRECVVRSDVSSAALAALFLGMNRTADRERHIGGTEALTPAQLVDLFLRGAAA
jgi:AcrR family transcriptional regulator